MADVADHRMQAPRERARLAIEFDTDRSAEFRRARRHSILVRLMRVLFPVSTVALFSTYGIFLQRSVSLNVGNGKAHVESFGISSKSLIARNPRYEGFDKQGGKFVVKARTAEQDFEQKGPVRLTAIDGQMVDAGGTTTKLTADSGTYDTKTSVLELFKQIEVMSSNGMTASLTRATVMSKDGRITSDEPVTVRMPAGQVNGRTMVIEQKARQVTFDNGVVAHLKQDTPKDKPARQAAPGSLTASDAPVDITSAKLVVDDTAKLAVFSGKVVATQADSTLTAGRLEVTYEGQAAPAMKGTVAPAGTEPPATKPAAGGADQSSRVKRLVARTDVVLVRGTERATAKVGEFDTASDHAVLTGDVVVTSGADRQATGDRAEMDNRNETATMTGNVVITQAKNVLKGRRLFVDRKAGTMAMASPAEAGLGKGRVTARMYQAEKEGAAGKPKAAAPAGASDPAAAQMLAMRADPSQPIDIEADTLDVNDKMKTAVFRGAVKAVQGDYTLSTEELVAVYSGEANVALGPQAKAEPKPPDAKGTGAQLQKVLAPRHVVVKTKDGRTASGNMAEFDLKANHVVLIGDVTLSQHSSLSNGPKAVLDLTTGTMQMEQSGIESGPVASSAGPAISASQPRQRVQVLLYPNEVKKDKAGGPAKDGPARRTGGERSSGWSTETAPGSPGTH